MLEVRGLVRRRGKEGRLMLLLGFGNKARQGKDSCAEAIRDYYDNHTQWNDEERRITLCGVKVGIFKFATALYQEVNDWLKPFNGVSNWANATIEEFTVMSPNTVRLRRYVLPEWVQPDPNPEVSVLAPYGKHPKLLQWWGTEYRRAQDPDYWTKKLFTSIPSNLDIALVTDVRFLNEADGVRVRGGYNINVSRLDCEGMPYYSDDRPVNHPSETTLDSYSWDFHLVNSDGHQALLGEQAVTLAEYLRALGPSK